MMSGIPHLAEWGHIRKDGSMFPGEVSARRLNDRSYLAIVRDLTERRRIEKTLLESEERLRITLQETHIGIWDWDIINDIWYASPTYYTMLGYEPEIGAADRKVWLDRVHPDDRDVVAEKIRNVLNGAKLKYQYEARMKHADGSYRWVSVLGHTIKQDENGKPTRMNGVRMDITERKRAEEIHLENLRLEAADKAKSEFLANMSHELRTPLNAILGFSELMKQGVSGKLNEKEERFIDNIHSSGAFLLTLINDILDLSKVEAGKVELVIDKMSVPVTIKETLTLIKEKATKHNVTLKTECDPAVEFIEADKQRFKQILFNLLGNAVKFSKPEGGTVTITAKKEGDMAKFYVSDTGIGIKEENMVKLFHKFEQIEPDITRKYEGTGLGLAISKQLVELHGGNIWAESKYGEGSTFTFILPIKGKKKAESD